MRVSPILLAALCHGCTFEVNGLPVGPPPDLASDVTPPSDLAGAIDAAPDLTPPAITFSMLTLLAGNGAGLADGLGANAKFNDPNGITADATGDVFVADINNALIRKIDASGNVTTIAGQSGQQVDADGTGTNATFNHPEAIAVDPSGDLWVADADANTIRRIAPIGFAVVTVAGNGTGYADGVGLAAQFNQPRGILADGTGNLYISDAQNALIRKMVIATSEVSTIAGGFNQPALADGTGTAARFNQPRGLALDRDGNLYVADSGNNCIRKIVLATSAVTTFAGTGNPGSADGIGAAAGFNQARGIVFDGNADLFVADTNNSTLRKIEIATARVTTLAGVAGMATQQLGPLPGRVDGAWGIAILPSGALVYSDDQTSDVILVQ